VKTKPPDKQSPQYLPALRFNWLTPYYDSIAGLTTPERRFKQALIRQAQFVPGHRVLDLASGTGTLALYTATKPG